MIKTRCKFQVTEVARINWGVVKREGKSDAMVERIKLQAVYATDSQGDQSFSSATPTGSLEIVVSNPNVIGQFEPGDHYYLDLIPVPKSGA